MDISISTAQNVSIKYQPAGLPKRILAAIIDLCLLGVVGGLLIAIIDTALNEVAAIIAFVILSFYHLLCELFFNGRSVGKAALQIRVVRLDGQKLSFWDCLLRWMFRLIDITISMTTAAIASILFTSNSQRLGDLAAGTTVISEQKNISLQKLSLYNTPDDYKIVFPQVSLLSDKDVSIIKEAMGCIEKTKEYDLLIPLALKIKELTGIQTEISNLIFIKTILCDYTALTENR